MEVQSISSIAFEEAMIAYQLKYNLIKKLPLYVLTTEIMA